MDSNGLKCQFMVIDWGNKTDEQCGNTPALAVYVSDDSRQSVVLLCQEHQRDALRNGDGPVFNLIYVPKISLNPRLQKIGDN